MKETVMRTIEVEMNVDRTPIFYNIFSPTDVTVKRTVVEEKGANAIRTYVFTVGKAYVKVAHNHILEASTGVYYAGKLVLESGFTARVLHSDVDELIVGIDNKGGKDVYLIEDGIPKFLFHVFYLSEVHSKDGEMEVMWTAPQGVADTMNKEEFLKLALGGVNDKKRYEAITHIKD